MRIARFVPASGGSPRLGLVHGSGLLDVAARAPRLPADLAGILAAGDEAVTALRRLAERPATDTELDDVTLLAPVAPRKCLAIGLNYADHAAEFDFDAKPWPTVFTKQVSCIGGPYDDVHLPRVSDRLDYEGELVMVIGRRCRHVPVEQASAVIAGYCVGNDFSVRDWQLRTGQFTIGKSFDTHGPIGPWMVTADALDVSDLRLQTFVDGQLRQDARTRDLIFSCEALVAHLSAAFTLEPGDVVFTGTPAGVGGGFDPPRFLEAGAEVRVEIEGIGHIVNRVVPEPEGTARIG